MTEERKQQLIESFAFTLDADELLNMGEVEYNKRLEEYLALHAEPATEEEETVTEENKANNEEIVTEINDLEEKETSADENSETNEAKGEEKDDDETEKSDAKSESVSSNRERESNSDRGSDTPDSSSASSVNYEEAYKEIFAPFKATKKMVQVRSVDEVRSLMQKGVAYVKNNEQMKPYKPMIKIMQEHGFTDPNDLAFAIDLVKNKDKNAIKKLLKEANYDAFEESNDDSDISNNYVPSVKAPSPDTLAMDTVLSELEEMDGDTLGTLLDDIVNPSVWDVEAKQILAQKPNLIKNLFNHVADGTYKIVMDEIAHRKYVGTLEESNTLEAYNRVLHDLHTKYQQERTTSSNNTNNTNTSANQVDKKKLSKASPTKGSLTQAPKSVKNDFPDPFSLSKEDLDKTYDQVMQRFRK